MTILTANEAKTNFGEMLMQAKRSPVRITRNGKPVAVVVSTEDYEAIEEMKHQFLLEKIAQSQNDIVHGKIVKGKQIFHRILKR